MERLSNLFLGLVRVRIFPESLFAIALLTCVFYLFTYVPRHAKAGEPVLALAHYFLTYAPMEAMNRPAYVLSDSIVAWDTPAALRTPVATLQSGDEVQALAHFRHWTHVRMHDGRDAWVSDDGLMNAETHEAEERLCEQVSEMPPQAAGHATDVDNVHIEPSRQSALVMKVSPLQNLKIFARKMVQRAYESGTPDPEAASKAGPMEAWYLVQSGSHAGWILGRRIQLDVPQNISSYSQDTNLVAWVALNRVDDGGHSVPQYVVASRVGNQTCDFTGIRVLTWWKKKQTYAIAYKEENLQGYFPILVTRQGSVPYFRLRVKDDDGAKAQRVYGLFDTMTHLIGTADNWQSDVMPEPSPAHTRTRRVAYRRD